MMNMEKEFNDNLKKFIIQSTCSFTCVREIKKRLKESGYKELVEQDIWKLKGNKFYIIRNDASIIAIELPERKNNKFSIITTHCDTPSLLLKPNGVYKIQCNALWWTFKLWVVRSSFIFGRQSNSKKG